MGEHFKRVQARRFTNQMTSGYDKLKVPTLIAAMRPELLERRYACSGAEAVDVSAGDVVHVRGPELRVLRGSVVVGSVEPEDAADLGSAVELGEGILQATVAEVSPIGGIFIIKISEGEE